MHESPSCNPLDDENGDWSDGPSFTARDQPHQFAGGPYVRSDTGQPVYPCPVCESLHTESPHLARRIGGAVGATAGGASAVAATLSSIELGATVGTLGGPLGVITGAVIAGLAGATAGCLSGARLGETIDQKVLHNRRCRKCGHRFSIAPDT